MGGWMGGVISNHLSVNNLDLIKIIDSVQRFMIYGDFPTYWCMYGLVLGWVGSCQITKIGIILDLFKIIQVYLKLYDL